MSSLSVFIACLSLLASSVNSQTDEQTQCDVVYSLFWVQQTPFGTPIGYCFQYAVDGSIGSYKYECVSTTVGPITTTVVNRYDYPDSGKCKGDDPGIYSAWGVLDQYQCSTGKVCSDVHVITKYKTDGVVNGCTNPDSTNWEEHGVNIGNCATLDGGDAFQSIGTTACHSGDDSHITYATFEKKKCGGETVQSYNISGGDCVSDTTYQWGAGFYKTEYDCHGCMGAVNFTLITLLVLIMCTYFA